MFDIFVHLRKLLKLNHIRIDSFVFQLHCYLTSMVLLAFAVIIAAKQYVGNPIDCIHNEDIPKEMFELYCWIHSSFTIPRGLNMRVGAEVPHPGILKSSHEHEGDRRYTSYYPWVGFLLVLQVTCHTLH